MKKITISESRLISIIIRVINEAKATEHVKNLYKSWAKNKSGNYDKAMSLMDDFFELVEYLPKSDFAQYTSADEMESEIIKVRDKKGEKEKKKSLSSDVDKIYENDNILVVKAKTYEASCKYGAGSKWCTAARDTDENWTRHNLIGVEFIWINKKLPSDDRNHKLSLFFKYDDERVDWCDRLNSCSRTAPYEKNDLGIKNWKQIFELCEKYFNVRLDEYKKKREEWNKNLVKKEEEILNKINDEEFLFDTIKDVITSMIEKFDLLAYHFAKIIRYSELGDRSIPSSMLIGEYFYKQKNKKQIDRFIEIFEDMIISNIDLFKQYYRDVVSYYFRYHNTNIIRTDELLLKRIKEELEYGGEEFLEVYEQAIIDNYLEFFKQLAKTEDFKNFTKRY